MPSREKNSSPASPVRTGLSVLLRQGPDSGGPVTGLLTHDGARADHHPGMSGRKALLEAGFPILRLFSPEHGITARAPDGASVGDGRDADTGLPVISLYGERISPLPEDLAGLDMVLVDLQDIGTRFYTYVWTLFLTMEACGKAGLPIHVLDRPNPVSGNPGLAEGPLPEIRTGHPYYDLYPLPVRHSLTIGELARLWQRTRFPQLDLTVTPMEGWSRSQFWPDTGLPFYPPSPAIRRWEAALFFGGVCLLEGTNVSVGRGTEEAFTQIGAPWLRPPRLLENLRARSLPGIGMVETEFRPGTDPHRGCLCPGIRFRAAAPETIRPVALGCHLLAALLQTHRELFSWETYPTKVNPHGGDHLIHLTGRKNPAAWLGGNPGVGQIASWTACPGWAGQVQSSLLYE